MCIKIAALMYTWLHDSWLMSTLQWKRGVTINQWMESVHMYEERNLKLWILLWSLDREWEVQEKCKQRGLFRGCNSDASCHLNETNQSIPVCS